MDWLQDFATWAWDRHHNPLSWYIRPLFIIPFCYFAYRRSLTGVLLTIVALLTSMFWFPKPDVPDAQAIEFLRMEKGVSARAVAMVENSHQRDDTGVVFLVGASTLDAQFPLRRGGNYSSHGGQAGVELLLRK